MPDLTQLKTAFNAVSTRSLAALLCGLLALSATGCATGGKDDSNMTVGELTANKLAPQPVGFTKFAGIADYTFKDLPLKVEWMGCKPAIEKTTVLVMHRDRAGYDAARFCDGWIAQTFLSSNIAIIAVNRPGFGNSNGRADFSGPKTVAATIPAVEAALKAMSPKNPPTGIWGYSSGATAALFASKVQKGLAWAIVGGGVYDLDDTKKKSSDSYLKREIDDVKNSEGQKGIEDRSISYDVSGLPKRILIYHGKQDTAIPTAQAVSFAETLNANEYQATVQLIDGAGHDIPADTHRQILDVLLQSMLR